MNIVMVSRDLNAQKRSEAQLLNLAETLKQRIAERTGQLAEANQRLVAEIAERERADARLQLLQLMKVLPCTPPSSKSRSRKHFRWSRPPRRTGDWRKGMCSEKSCCESASRDCATPRQKHFAFSTFCNSSIPGRRRAIHLAGRSGKNIKN